MRHILLATLAAGACLGASAATLMPQEALQRVKLPAAMHAPAVNGQNAAQPALAFTASEGAVPTYYVFQQPQGGYLVVGAQSEAAPLLGYSDHGTFDASHMAPALRWWLGELSRQIAYAAANPSKPSANTLRAPRRAERRAIAPLTTTLWNQEAPYNDLCPSIGDTVCPTGCVATAMAQVIKYHNYPAKGTGQHSYTWKGKTLSFDYGATTFDWANMTNTYGPKSTPQEKAAVATLMKACGVSVDMSYGANESGAVSQDIPSALTSYFGYDPSVAFVDRQYHGLDDWETMVYDQLATTGPVLYCGRGDGGGHQFVCDGYQGDGYFHFNWGWGGMSDGYYLLYALDPMSQGTGGSSLTGQGFSTGQGIVTGMKPYAGGTAPRAVIGLEGEMDVSASGGVITVECDPVNASGVTAEDFALGAVFVNNAGDSTWVANSSGSTHTLQPGYYMGNNGVTYRVSTSKLSTGTYQMLPAVKWADDTWTLVAVNISVPQHAVVTKTSSYSVKASMPTVGTLTVSDVKLETPLYESSPFKVTAKFVNDTQIEQLQVVRLGFATESWMGGLQLNAYGTMYPVDMLPGDEMTVTYISHIFQGSVEPGESYYMVFFDENSQILSEPQEVTFSQASGSAEASVTTWDIAQKDGLVNPKDIRVTGTVECTSGYWASSLHLAILSEQGSLETNFASPYIFLNSGDTDQFDFTGSWPSAREGVNYQAVLCSLSGNTLHPVTEFRTIRFGTPSGVGDIEAQDSAAAEYYNLQGQRLQHPTPGTLVIERRGTRLSKVLVP